MQTKKQTFLSLLPVRQLFVLMILALISSLTPFISFWGLSKVIDIISNSASTIVSAGSLVLDKSVFVYIILIGIFLVTNDSFEAIRWTYSIYMEGNIFLQMKSKLLEKISTFPYIDIFESPQFLNKLRLADESIPRFHGFFNSLAMLASGLLGSIPFLWIGATTCWWVPFAIILAFLPALIMKWNLEERLWALEIQNGEKYKEASVQESVLLDASFAKEIRLWNAGSFILNRWKNNRRRLLAQTTKLRNQSMGLTFMAHLFEGIADCAIIAFLYFLVIKNQLSTGNFVFAITAIIQLRQNAFTVLLFGLDINIAFKRLNPFFEILNAGPIITGKIAQDISINENDINSKKQINSTNQKSIINLQNLSFSYPYCEEKALKNINLIIEEKEKIAVVGANGSGKSTLVKLISGMYPVSEGSYIFANRNSCEIEIEEFRKYFSAVYQDYARFPLTLEENICISDSGFQKTLQKNDELFNALQKQFPILNTALKPSTLLTRRFEDGFDLSGGEWQRVALMRCAFANREIVLLDEPTAALDPNSEHQILEAMLRLMQDKTAIIVTHRLALCQKVDRIIVLDKGEIIEVGSHKELIQKNGVYAQMYKTQGSYYIENIQKEAQ